MFFCFAATLTFFWWQLPTHTLKGLTFGRKTYHPALRRFGRMRCDIILAFIQLICERIGLIVLINPLV